eukprot:gnl/TRDRNA2_/TRDRNA2_160896_c0_seq4.p1 gnl/TRDRNA2_/TRDRNA2_160896_c0~~gnl/TRDRNA2_/TRDRNA2_160896_c0_seq4.p1  ORF type:complete len:253 (+),score=52.24 gnl/TRDRNA2_/TRDRNA2_160896_c0_seq4:50-760(+)
MPDPSHKYRLQYFDIRGIAETSRMLFAIAKQPYTDSRFPLTFGTPGDFSTIAREEFVSAKEKGELDVSLGKVPYLEVDGVKFGQSKAIERYLARKFGMMGSTPEEELQIDGLCETVIDIKKEYQKFRGNPDQAEQADAYKRWFSEELPNWIHKAEKSLPANQPGPFLVGKKISLADVVFFHLLEDPEGFFDHKQENAKASLGVAVCPKIKAAMEATAANPELQAWIENRPEGSVPF